MKRFVYFLYEGRKSPCYTQGVCSEQTLHSPTRLLLFAAPPCSPNDIPEGGKGELRVAMGTGCQREPRILALGRRQIYPPLLRRQSWLQGLGVGAVEMPL